MTEHNTPSAADQTAPQDENQLIAERREKLKALREQVREQGGVAFPNDFKPADRAEALQQAHADKSAEQLDAEAVQVSLGGRMMLKRVTVSYTHLTLPTIYSV